MPTVDPTAIDFSKAIGLYGGTFDPIHVGHILPVETAAQRIGIERVHLIPCHIPPHRQTPAVPAPHRLAMVELACESHPLFVADDIELRRHTTSYSIDTLKAFRLLHPQCPLLFFMGQDAFNGIQSWHQWQDILSYCHIVVCARPGYKISHDHQLTNWAAKHSTDRVNELRQGLCGKLYFIQSDLLAISSTAVREQLQQNTLPSQWLDAPVADYIAAHGLYRAAIA